MTPLHLQVAAFVMEIDICREYGKVSWGILGIRGGFYHVVSSRNIRLAWCNL